MSEGTHSKGAGIVDVRLVLTDIGFLAFCLAYALMTLVFRDNVASPAAALLELAAAWILVAGSSLIVRRAAGNLSTVLRALMVFGACGLLFKTAERMQHLFVSGWMDNHVLSLEASLWGAEVSVALEAFVHPLLTEWMMFSYLAYFPLLLIVALLCLQSGSAKAVNEYLLDLSLAYMISFVGFMIFPLATQMRHDPGAYAVPLDGWVFTWLGELIRTDLHAPGGALPSPHCAAASVMLVAAHRHSRKAFYVLLPVVISLYVSTVYCRFHYVWDTMAGVFVGIAVTALTPVLVRRVRQKLPLPLLALKEAGP